MDTILTTDQFKEALPPQIKKTVTQEVIDEINNALSDPEAAEIFKENLLTFSNVLQQGKFKLQSYINAVKYVGFKVMGYNNKESYRRTFPDKYTDFLANGVSQKDISSYVTAYNKSKLVNLIFAQALVPTHVLNAPLFQKAINTQALLMVTAKSEKVRQDAANSLLTHLKPPEEAKLQLDVNINKSGSIIGDYEDAMRMMVEQQRKLIEGGGDVRQIANAPIRKKEQEENVVDVEPEPVVEIVDDDEDDIQLFG